MREWWANVYPESTMREKHGGCAMSREICEGARRPEARYMIHVRLKPEGAPRRYASEAEREWWEHHSGREWTDVQIRQLREIAKQEKAVADYWNRISPIG